MTAPTHKKQNNVASAAARHGAAPTTVETVMYELRAYGLAALAGPNCQRRLADLSSAQVCEVIERLDTCGQNIRRSQTNFYFRLRS